MQQAAVGRKAHWVQKIGDETTELMESYKLTFYCQQAFANGRSEPAGQYGDAAA